MSRKPATKQESETARRIRCSLIGHRDPTHRLWVAGKQLAAEPLLVWHRRRDPLLSIVAAVAGTIGELVFVRFDVRHYTHPSVLGIPAWFPLAVGTTSVIGARMAATIESIGRHGGA